MSDIACPLCNLKPWSPDSAAGCNCSYEDMVAEVARLRRALSDGAKSKPAWYTEELEEILGLLADTLGVPRYHADALLAAAKARVTYAELLRSALQSLEQAYSNKHSPQHREACLNEARSALAKNPAECVHETNSKFSEFIRNAEGEERAKVFERVIDKSIERQQDTLRHQSGKKSPRCFDCKDGTCPTPDACRMDDMVNRFLRWPLPESVLPDACVMDRAYPHRSGTNLLTANEAKAMLEFVGACHQVNRERTDADYAIEFGGYLAEAAKLFMQSVAAVDVASQRHEDAEPGEEAAATYDVLHGQEELRSERWDGLRTAVYEFEKRRDRASQSVACTKQEGAR